MATLYCERASNPVRVRNLSPSGGLIEGATLPPVGTAVILRRGALESPGTVVWVKSGKAGLSFTGLVDVSAWLPTKEAKPQTQADQITYGLKHTRRALAAAAVPAIDDRTMPMIAVVAELAALRADLDRLGDKLADDAVLLASHPEVQFLDAAGQRIGRIIDALRAAAA